MPMCSTGEQNYSPTSRRTKCSHPLRFFYKSSIFDFLEIFEILLWDPKIRIEREKLCRFASRMVGFIASRLSAIFTRMSPIWAGLVPYFHEYLALRALSGEIPLIACDS